MSHENMSNSVDELQQIASVLRKRYEESRVRTETLALEIQTVEDKIERLQAGRVSP